MGAVIDQDADKPLRRVVPEGLIELLDLDERVTLFDEEY
jgi:hypothetical protein